jgi:NAD(P)-dependent dehydrogenase (short-subunit alcohol dehydrogenase family)
VLEAAEVEPAELAEVHVINAMVPFLLATRLRPLLVKSRCPDRYIVNVAAAEGSFSYRAKQPRHPHTNMAKAALNMFTRTSWPDYLRDGIYMNSVDPGWVSQENPHPKKLRIEAAAFCPPLDAIDGAARVIAPILRGVRGDRFAGALFRHHEPAPW